jgi:uncharacterized RDD family membrane protein YckC
VSRTGAPEPPPADGQTFVGELAAQLGRAGAATSRLALRPARAAARSSRSVVTGEAERAIDGFMAGPLPEAVARSLIEHRVMERVGAELAASGDLETVVLSALEHEQTERLVLGVLQSPALERILGDAIESRLTAELTERMLRSPEFGRALKHILASPEVRSALTQQTTSLGGEAMAAIRRGARRRDDSAESRVRRRSRSHRSSEAGPTEYAGVATRGVALAIDALLAQLIFVIGGALIGLVASLFGHLRPEWLVGVLAGAGWLLVVGTYFVGFWSTAGQTPGMRLMRLRVVDPRGAPPSAGRSSVRLVGLALAIIPLFAGFLPALFDERRRALQDFLAGTVVRYDEHPEFSRDGSIRPNSSSASPTAETGGGITGSASNPNAL